VGNCPLNPCQSGDVADEDVDRNLNSTCEFGFAAFHSIPIGFASSLEAVDGLELLTRDNRAFFGIDLVAF
jgi:hypothetical protein